MGLEAGVGVENRAKAEVRATLRLGCGARARGRVRGELSQGRAKGLGQRESGGGDLCCPLRA